MVIVSEFTERLSFLYVVSMPAICYPYKEGFAIAVDSFSG